MRVGLPVRAMALLARKRICHGDSNREKLGMTVPYLIYVICVELHCAASLLGFPRQRDGGHALLSES
jgi:hypothetical protein